MRVKGFFLSLTTLLLLCGCGSPAADGVAASVDGYIITNAELDRYYHSQDIDSPGLPTQDEERTLRLNLLRELIDRQILLGRAERLGLLAVDAEVDKRFEDYRSPYGTGDQFREHLREQNLTVGQLRNELRRTLTVEKLFQREIRSKLSVEEAEMRAYYEQNKARFHVPEQQVHVAWIRVTAAKETPVPNRRNDDATGMEEGSALGVAAVGLVLAFAAIPDLRAILDQGSSWFIGEVAFNRVNIELVPLLGAGDEANWSRPQRLLTPLFFAYPVAATAVLWRSLRPDHRLLVYWSAAFFALTLSQSRFVNTFTVSFAIVLGGGAALLVDACATWCGGRRARVVACAAASLVAAYYVFEPTFRFYRSYWVPTPPAVRTLDVLLQARKASFRAAARFLAQTAPPVLDADGKPTYAVLCEWSFGNEVRYRSGRPVIQDNFGPYVAPEGVAAAGRYFKATGEEAALAELQQMGARYVIADIEGAGYREKYGQRAMASRLVRLHGSGGRVVLVSPPVVISASRVVAESAGRPAALSDTAICVNPNCVAAPWFSQSALCMSSAPSSCNWLGSHLQSICSSGLPSFLMTVMYAFALLC